MSYLGQEVKQVYPSNSAIGGENLGQVPLFAVMWCPSRDFIWDGYVAADGQELDDNLFPDAKAGIVGGRVPVADSATWLADPTARASYVATSSAGKFRIPDLNGKFAGSLGAVFLRGDGARSADTKGVIQEDANKLHQHTSAWSGADGRYGANPDTLASVFLDRTTTGGSFTTGSYVSPEGEDEARPLNATGCWVIKLFGSIVNVGAVDAGQLATVYAALQSEKVDIASFLGSNQNLNTPGYQKLPGGLIMQWGRVSVNSGASLAFTYPIAFNTATLIGVCSHNVVAGGNATIHTFSNTGASIYNETTAGPHLIGYVVIGY